MCKAGLPMRQRRTTFEPVNCAVCTRVHLVNPQTGKVVGADDSFSPRTADNLRERQARNQNSPRRVMDLNQHRWMWKSMACKIQPNRSLRLALASRPCSAASLPPWRNNLMRNNPIFIRRRSAAVRSSWWPTPPSSAIIGIRAIATFIAPHRTAGVACHRPSSDSGHSQ